MYILLGAYICVCRIVESVGEGVVDMRKGDHVVPIFNGECGHCAYCKSDKTNLCEKFRVNPFKSVMVNGGGTRFSTKDGEPIFHFLNTSTFSEYTVLDSACVVNIDPNAPLNKMSLLSCGVSTGTNSLSLSLLYHSFNARDSWPVLGWSVPLNWSVNYWTYHGFLVAHGS